MPTVPKQPPFIFLVSLLYLKFSSIYLQFFLLPIISSFLQFSSFLSLSQSSFHNNSRRIELRVGQVVISLPEILFPSHVVLTLSLCFPLSLSLTLSIILSLYLSFSLCVILQYTQFLSFSHSTISIYFSLSFTLSSIDAITFSVCLCLTFSVCLTPNFNCHSHSLSLTSTLPLSVILSLQYTQFLSLSLSYTPILSPSNLSLSLSDTLSNPFLILQN